MAQPIFDEHPLQDYLRRLFFTYLFPLSHHNLTESGDIFEPMPGAMSDLSNPFSEEYADDPDADLNLWSWLPMPVLHLAEVSLSFHAFYQAHYVGRSACCKHIRAVTLA